MKGLQNLIDYGSRELKLTGQTLTTYKPHSKTKPHFMMIPNEIIADIFHHLNPNRLDYLASSFKRARYIVNKCMNRRRYIDMWLDNTENEYIYSYDIETKKYKKIETILKNYWYFNLKCEDDIDIIGPKILTILKECKYNILSIKFDYGYYTHLNNVFDYGEPLSIYKLSLTYSIIKDINELGNVHSLRLHSCKSINNKAIDVKPLSNVYNLTLNSIFDIINIDELDCVNALYITNCSSTPYKAFANICNVHTFKYSNYWGRASIDSLKYVHTLAISIPYSSCNNLANLANVHTLNLSKCNNTNIDLDKCKGFSALGDVHNLDLSYFNDLRDENLDTLGSVHTLNLYGVHSICNINALSGVYNLDLCKCKNIMDVTALGNVNKLCLSFTNIVDVSGLCNVYNLDITNCKSIIDVSGLGKVHKLNMNNCSNVSDVSMLGDVYELDIHECVNIVDVSGLRKVHKLYMYGCVNVNDVSMLGDVHELDIRYCNKIDVVNLLLSGVLANVYELDVSAVKQMKNSANISKIMKKMPNTIIKVHG